MFRAFALTFLALLVSAPTSLAFSPDRPSRRDIFSPNGKYVLDVNPETKVHVVYAVADRTIPLWSFSRPIRIGQIFLSDNGKVVALVAWQFAHGEGDCIDFWDKTGKIKSYPFSEICPSPRIKFPLEPGPIGGISFIWSDHVFRDDDILRITTTGWFEYEFSLEDGEILSHRFLARNVLYRLWFYLLLLFGAIALWFLSKWRRKRREQVRATPSPVPSQGILAGPPCAC